MLPALVRYYEQTTEDHPDWIAPIGYNLVHVALVASIDGDGNLASLIPLVDRASMTRMVPSQAKRTSKVTANFLCDNAAYFFGFDTKSNPERALLCFSAASDLHHEILDGVDSICATAILAFFDRGPCVWDHSSLAGIDKKILATGNIVFAVDAGDSVLDPLGDIAIRTAWQNYRASKKDGEPMRCLVTGEVAPIARLHPVIKGVYGANQSGASLVSFNASSFESYGHDKEQGRNAPVGEYAAQAYTAALNYLLADPKHHVRLADTTIVYWSEHAGNDADEANSLIFSALMGNASAFVTKDDKRNADEFVNNTMNGLVKGHYRSYEGIDLDATFYVLGLAPSDARLVVRFFHRDSFGRMLENLQKHYQRIDIADSSDQRRFLTPYQLLREVENPKAKKPVATPRLIGPLLQSILEDAPYPHSLYANAILRTHATQEDSDNHVRKASRGRAAIIRACLTKNHGKEGYDEMELTPNLNEARNETAYCLGRAFAILEQIQEVANKVATITNSYFNAASTTPSAVFPTLYRLSISHLAKIGREHPGWAQNLKMQLQDVLAEGRVDAFPRRLTLEQQGDFILGYVHQRNHRFVGRKTEQTVDSGEKE